MPLSATAKNIRKSIIEAAHRAQVPHVGSALSCVDILTTVYFDYLRLDPWCERDIFIMGKAHAALSLYCTLTERGLMAQETLLSYCQDNGTLPAHLDRFAAPGIEVSGGSLGHGLSIGLGMAHGFKLKNEDRRVVVLMGDGETQEGAVWEAAMFAPKLGLDNITAIIDRNNLQGYGRATEICTFEPLAAKWEAFGWHVQEINGHDHEAIGNALTEDSHGKPRIIIANTVKGKGVSFMEDQLIWHYYLVTEEHKKLALEEIAA